MPYSELLSKLISDKNLSVKEVSKRCFDYGQKVTASYISIIKNPSNNKIPSNEFSRALAKACEAEYSECLVLEAYIDKAPEEMQGFFNSIKKTVIDSAIMIYKNSFSDEDLNNIRLNMNKMYMSLIIIEYAKMIKNNRDLSIESVFNTSAVVSNNILNVLLELKQPQSIVVDDNSMYPILPEGSKVIIEHKLIDEYHDGDILAVSDMKNHNILIRKCLFTDTSRNIITLFALNQGYEVLSFKLNEIEVIGKINQVITEIR
jgi:hypothetical protein